MRKARKQQTKPASQKVRVIRDTRDARQDYFIDYSEARRLYTEGRLHFDLTNGCYGENKKQWNGI